MRNFKYNLIALSCLFVLAWILYYQFWGRHLYLITAYCDCPICVNIPEYQDGQFASGKHVYWGGIAADPKVPFGAKASLVPLWPLDFWKIGHILRDRTEFRVEDRGGKIKGRHIDVFIPASMGGHQTALRWGRQKMRIRLNGQLAD